MTYKETRFILLLKFLLWRFSGEIFPLFKLNVFDQELANRCFMETRVLVLRWVLDGRTSVVVQVLDSNTVLKCEVLKNSLKKLETGQFATIRVLAYDPPNIRVSIAECAGTGVDCEAECHVSAGTEQQHTPPRKRMCFK
jgi:hypothetical protein